MKEEELEVERKSYCWRIWEYYIVSL